MGELSNPLDNKYLNGNSDGQEDKIVDSKGQQMVEFDGEGEEGESAPGMSAPCSDYNQQSKD